jgi:hypothetical protein
LLVHLSWKFCVLQHQGEWLPSMPTGMYHCYHTAHARACSTAQLIVVTFAMLAIAARAHTHSRSRMLGSKLTTALL